MSRRALALVLVCVAACAESAAGPPASPPGETTTPPPTTAAPETPTATPVAAASAAPAPRAPVADAAPPPLRGAAATPPFADPHADAGAPCTPDALRARLQDIVDKCRPKATSLCGTVKVRASGGDASAVAAAFDLGTTTGVKDFARCVTDQVNAVHWECAEPGRDIQVDLGCKL